MDTQQSEIMDLTALDHLDLPPTADLHSHLRQDAMMQLVTPLIKTGGVSTVFVMPNTIPPITQVSQAVSYHKELSTISPETTFLMSLYLHSSVDRDVIAEAARTDIIYGVKLYPAGVTTNSQDGVMDIERFYPVFEAMQEHGLVLNLHGESPGLEILKAEAGFVPQLFKLHSAFPNLSICLEHVSTREGIDAVRRCGPKVKATITSHHLWTTTEDAEQDVFCFCKPVAKSPEDRIALVQAAIDGSGKFFFGSDSAPHPMQAKEQANSAAGCFTQGWCTALVIGALENGIKEKWISKDQVTREALQGFLSGYGRKFYKLNEDTESRKLRIRLEHRGEVIPRSIKSADGKIEVVPFRRGQEIMSLSWIE